jgi:pimeloyl-ACP methyl ester carboxylesterase
METGLTVDGAVLPATITMPTSSTQAGVVVVHGAEAGERSYFLYEHLADVLTQNNVAVLRYDRRPSLPGDDVPLQAQAADVLVALRRLRECVHLGPVGVWGWSQGAWAAAIAAADAPGLAAFLVCVSFCGVSPAEQMRVGCAQQLRKHGFTEGDVADLTATRLAVEEFLRSGRGKTSAEAQLGRAASRPWFPLAYLPDALPERGTWPDMDFDPQPVLANLTCPVLAFYGETDEWMPIEASIAAWRTAEEHGRLTDLTVARLPGTDHLPTTGALSERGAISDRYTQTMTRWLTTVTSRRP